MKLLEARLKGQGSGKDGFDSYGVLAHVGVRVHCDAARGKYEGRRANGDPGRKVIGSARCHARSMRGITAAPFDEVGISERVRSYEYRKTGPDN